MTDGFLHYYNLFLSLYLLIVSCYCFTDIVEVLAQTALHS